MVLVFGWERMAGEEMVRVRVGWERRTRVRRERKRGWKGRCMVAVFFWIWEWGEKWKGRGERGTDLFCRGWGKQ